MSLRSMTAFARRDEALPEGRLSWELRSVNHRYLEASCRLPEEFRVLEPKVRDHIQQALQRGKVECTLHFRAATAALSHYQLNEHLARELAKLSRVVDGMLYSSSPVHAMDILRFPGVLEATAASIERLHEPVLQLLAGTLEDLIAARTREGVRLQEALDERRRKALEIVGVIRPRLPEILETYKKRLLTRLEELRLQVDAQRLEQEMVLLLQRIDVEEELKRLETHLSEISGQLTSHQPQVGRRLDFLMKELHREANTLCYKALDLTTIQAGVEL
ncbi:MAG: YicC/YloC family endoribonuclease, partial [Pseudomonadota bacterium]